MSFDVDINSLLQFGYNVFASAETILWLFIGGSFGLFLLGKLINIFR